MQALNFVDSIALTATDQPVELTAARNEWTSFALQVTGP